MKPFLASFSKPRSSWDVACEAAGCAEGPYPLMRCLPVFPRSYRPAGGCCQGQSAGVAGLQKRREMLTAARLLAASRGGPRS